MELETDKAVVELPCPHAGVVGRILVKEGATVSVGQPVLVIDGAGTEVSGSRPQASGAAAAPTKAPGADASGSKAAATPATPASGHSPLASPPSPSSGPVEFKLPSLGEGVASADIADISVKVGDIITNGQILMELETDKAVVELPSTIAGKITKLLVKSGESVKPGQVLLVVEGIREPEALAPGGSNSPSKTSKAPGADASSSKPSTSPAITPTIMAAPAVPSTLNPQSSTSPVPAAPATRRLARELGVDIALVKGTGPGGRITQEDVQAYVRGKLQQIAVAPVKPARVLSGGISAPPLPDFSRFGVTVREPMNKIARTAAENLTVSWNVIPHVTQHDKADITDLEAARKRFGEGIGKNGPKVTMTAIVMKALATCLQAFPKFNSSLDPETNEIVLKKFYNIGCAVDTPNGLVVPVIKDCNTKSILTIAGELTDLAGKARDRKLSIDSMQGATCTVTNLGGLGGIAFTPIVNYPEVCILGMSRSQMELKLEDGKVVERMMLPISLSYDHRVINGADAARFVTALCNMLADPFQLLAAC
ncbi:MAG: biotin/lipoyl-binding protein [Planctomycetota bacterium]|nr:MAG: biotin/lipoyl-binding protein [Planctomycetota bacterium]